MLCYTTFLQVVNYRIVSESTTIDGILDVGIDGIW